MHDWSEIDQVEETNSNSQFSYSKRLAWLNESGVQSYKGPDKGSVSRYKTRNGAVVLLPDSVIEQDPPAFPCEPLPESFSGETVELK